MILINLNCVTFYKNARVVYSFSDKVGVMFESVFQKGESLHLCFAFGL